MQIKFNLSPSSTSCPGNLCSLYSYSARSIGKNMFCTILKFYCACPIFCFFTLSFNSFIPHQSTEIRSFFKMLIWSFLREFIKFGDLIWWCTRKICTVFGEASLFSGWTVPNTRETIDDKIFFRNPCINKKPGFCPFTEDLDFILAEIQVVQIKLSDLHAP